MVKGVICDLDGFLVKTWGTEPLPGVVETLAELRRRGIPIAVATNQAGPLWREAVEHEKYPTAQEVASRLITCADRLGLADAPWYVAIWDVRVTPLFVRRANQGTPTEHDPVEQVIDKTVAFIPGIIEEVGNRLAKAMGDLPGVVSGDPGWRKPAPGMLYAACAKWGIQPEEAVYGGDLVTDQQVAERAGMPFVWTLPSVMTLLESEV